MNPTPLSRHEFQERIGLVLIALLAFSPYFAVNLMTAQWPAQDFSTALDLSIPFQPAWEIIYVSIYFYMFLPVAYLRDRQIFRRAVISFCCIQLFCFAVYLLLPVTLTRPELGNINTQFLHWGVALNWLLDQPRNLFPSLHLANAFLVSLLLVRLQPKLGKACLFWACLIGYSTLAVKHHLLIDVISGILLAVLADRFLIAPAIPKNLSPATFFRRRNLVLVVSLYPASLLCMYLLWLGGWRPFVWPPA